MRKITKNKEKINKLINDASYKERLAWVLISKEFPETSYGSWSYNRLTMEIIETPPAQP